MKTTGMSHVIRRALAILATPPAVLALLAAPAAAGAGAGDDPGGGALAAQATGGTTVTLITGDRVRLITRNGRQDVALLPKDSGPSAVSVQRTGGHVFAIPRAAAPLLAAGRLDRRLFDVTRLVADGRTGERGRELPLLLAGGGALGAGASRTAAPSAPGAPAGSTAGRRLPALGVTSVQVTAGGADRFWDALTTPAAGPARAAAELTGGVTKVWLDGRVHARLDRSVKQIGVPAARAKGLDGRGVTVAVLDTGIDDQQADLTSRIAGEQNFTEEAGTDDGFGHGTHVASIVAGTGANSGGKYAGVAPGARLLDGKVLDSSGSGDESWVLAGMEWAAARAPVVNLSLGGGPTDGSDPLAQAVDSLSASTGALFIVAAGNDGDGGEQSTVQSPGTGASALTVGAVDRKDAIADFSSRGPRTGSALIKPEITAPGVDIVAAQADGTQLGEVVAPKYVALSGTSMATPHVAGAAALLKQQHPAWTWAQLKAGLASTAKPSAATPIFTQGAGRVDLAAATGDRLRVSSASLDLGMLAYPHGGDAPITQRVTYTNDRSTAVQVHVTGALVDDATGKAAPAGALTHGPKTFTLAAGASRAVAVTVKPDLLRIGRWSGALTATTPAGATRTVLGLVKEPERYDLALRVLDRKGRPAAPGSGATLANVGTGEVTFVDDLTRNTRVAPGTYVVTADVFQEGDRTVTQVTQFDVRITGNRRVTLDGRGSVPYRTTFQRAGAVPAAQSLDLSIGNAEGWFYGSSFTAIGFGANDILWARPTPAAIKTGRFSFAAYTDARERLLAMATASGAPLTLTPEPTWWDARLEGRKQATVVRDGGQARGAWVLLDPPAGAPADAAVAAAAAAGAAGVLLPTGPDAFPELTAQPSIPAVLLPRAQWQALSDRAGTAGVAVVITGREFSPYTYGVVTPATGRVPASLAHAYKDAELGRSSRDVRSHSAGGTGQTFTFPALEGGSSALGQPLRHGARRTDYYSPNVPWRTSLEAFLVPVEIEPGFEILSPRAVWEGTERRYVANKGVAETWAGQPARPAVPKPDEFGFAPARLGGDIAGGISPLTDTAGRAGGFGYGEVGGDTLRWSLHRSGKQLAAGEDGYVEAAGVPAAKAGFRLDVTTRRAAGGGWALSTATSTRYRFDSAGGSRPVPLALLDLDAALPLDIANSAARGSTLTFPVTGRLPRGLAAPRLTTLTVEASFDGGRTWTTAKAVRRSAAGFDVTLKQPNTAGPVALRLSAAAAGGVSVRQTITAAYTLR